jgi:hypothetical protein
MNTTLRTIDLDRDYDMLVSWWKGHGWEPLPKGAVNTLGVICAVDGVDTCAAFLLMSNTNGVAMLEWLVTNPEANVRAAYLAIPTVTAFIEGEAARMNYGVLLTACRQPSLVRMYERCGFTVTDTNVTHMIKILDINQPKEGE